MLLLPPLHLKIQLELCFRTRLVKSYSPILCTQAITRKIAWTAIIILKMMKPTTAASATRKRVMKDYRQGLMHFTTSARGAMKK